MEVIGKFILKLPLVTGESSRGAWSKQEFVVETIEQFPKKVCMSLWGDKIRELEIIPLGEMITASINLESREYNGRWFTEVRCWRLQRGAVTHSAPGVGTAGVSATSATPQYGGGSPVAQAQDNDYSTSTPVEDDLPF